MCVFDLLPFDEFQIEHEDGVITGTSSNVMNVATLRPPICA
jgi:hypothetical protein